MKKDITSISDIKLLVNNFYEKVKRDETIGYIFTDVVKVNWEQHLPVMYKFWENIIFFTGGYTGNPLETHKMLDKKIPLEKKHFIQWTKIFVETVDELFRGEKAELVKQRAQSIATIMELKIHA